MNVAARSGPQQQSHRAVNQQRPLRMLISAKWAGGVGGAERNLASTLSCLDGHDVVVYAESLKRTGFFTTGPSIRYRHGWRSGRPQVRGKRHLTPILTPLVQARGHYDVYLHFWGGPMVGERVTCPLRLLIPSGNSTVDLEGRFDLVLSQAPGGVDLVADKSKHLAIAPPTELMSRTSDPVPGLPSAYLLTVFNPYNSQLKGVDLLLRAADLSPHPIVWAHDTTTIDSSASVAHHENIMPLRNLTQPQLRHVYEKCRAYVSFSRSEGYGWAVADALLLGRPVVSRRLGVLTWFNSAANARLYNSDYELMDIIADDNYQPTECDLDTISPRNFASQLLHLVDTHTGN